MEPTIAKPQITILYGPSRRISWYTVPTTTVLLAINEAIEFALIQSVSRPNDHPVMIELKE